MLKPELTIYDYLRILKKRKWIIVMTLTAVMISTLLFTQLQRSIYQTQSTVQLKTSSNYTEMFGDLIPTTSVNINAEAKVIRSSAVVDRAVLKVFPDKKDNPAFLRSKSDEARGQISTKVDPNTLTIDIVMTGENPGQITKMADGIAEAYIVYTQGERQRDKVSSFEFINSQLRFYTAKLESLETELQNYRVAEKIVDISVELRSKLEVANSLTRELSAVYAEQKTLEERLARMRNKDTAARIAMTSASTSTSRLQEDLYVLEVRRATLLQKYTVENPLLKTLDAQIEGQKQQIQAHYSTLADRETAGIEAGIGIQEAKYRALTEGVERMNAEINQLPRKQAALARLEQRVAFVQSLVSIFSKKVEEWDLSRVEKDKNLPQAIEKAVEPTVPIRPNKQVNAIIGFLAGIVLGLFFAFFIESVDVSVSTVEEVESYIGLPVLGIIPFIVTDEIPRSEEAKMTGLSATDSDVSEACVAHHHPQSIVAEAFRILRTNLHFASMGKTSKVFLVASALPTEGKTFVAVNLAVTLAQLGSRVVLCDFNLRDPEIHGFFGMSKNPGLTDTLIGDLSWLEAVRQTPIPNLSMLPSGPIPPNPSELIISDTCTNLLMQLRDAFDFVICDSSPLIPVTDGAILASKADRTILVHNAVKSSLMMLIRAKTQVSSVHAQIMGVVLNQLRSTLLMDTDVPINYYYASKDKAKRHKKRSARQTV